MEQDEFVSVSQSVVKISLTANSYRDQFGMLANSMEREREDLQIRERAQNKVSQLRFYPPNSSLDFDIKTQK